MHSFLKLGLTDSVVEQKLIKVVTEKSQMFKNVSLCVCYGFMLHLKYFICN